MINKRFYEMRGECSCFDLNDLWEQINRVDDSQAEAQRYAEMYIKTPQLYDKDIYFKRALETRMNSFDESIQKYQDIFVKKCEAGSIVFESEGKEIDTKKAVSKDGLVMRCKSCRTEIPHLKYPGWN